MEIHLYYYYYNLFSSPIPTCCSNRMGATAKREYSSRASATTKSKRGKSNKLWMTGSIILASESKVYCWASGRTIGVYDPAVAFIEYATVLL